MFKDFTSLSPGARENHRRTPGRISSQSVQQFAKGTDVMSIMSIIAAGLRRRIASGELVPITAKPEECCDACGSPLWGGSCPTCNDPDEYEDDRQDADTCPYCKGTGYVTVTSHHHPKQLVLGGAEPCDACDSNPVGHGGDGTLGPEGGVGKFAPSWPKLRVVADDGEDKT